ncbi:MAG: UDP-N-acetylglucosamine 2-epimerase [Bdellovibrionaceae bacterium]|nr:UDP-N-acetylglucosamine 2-epimerase [Pseudobdellovibrionaceae bacterium]
MKKRILFVTGTRADFGKLKPLINSVKYSNDFEYQIFVTGMHTLSKYGRTLTEIEKSGFENTFIFLNQIENDNMEIVLANTIIGLSRYLHENPVDLIVVHGDRVEALAGASVGALQNILVAHIEGGEVSGTIDEIIRHSVSKLSHIHFVANENAKKRLLQLGEDKSAIFNIGSPDIDIMLSDDLPSLSQVKRHYDIKFDDYSIALLHPVTTENQEIAFNNAKIFAQALLESGRNYVVIYPNNDSGSNHIFRAYELFQKNSKFKIFPSLRFEYFLTLLKNSRFIIGNSSCGIHEAPVYGIPTINLGTRQNRRFKHTSIADIPFENNLILKTIAEHGNKRFPICHHYGYGKSAEHFLNTLSNNVWNISNQKQFIELYQNPYV